METIFQFCDVGSKNWPAKGSSSNNNNDINKSKGSYQETLVFHFIFPKWLNGADFHVCAKNKTNTKKKTSIQISNRIWLLEKWKALPGSEETRSSFKTSWFI